MDVQLPEALPELYLQWMAFVVAIEQAIRNDRSLRSKAARRRLVYGPSAQTTHHIVYEPIIQQAQQADAAGTEVRPVVEAEPDALGEVVAYLQRWSDWLFEEEIPDRVKVDMPLPETAALRAQLIKEINTRLSGT
jgi:hypothetical protein